MKIMIDGKRKKRGALLVLLSIVLCAGMIPAGAFAAGIEKQVTAVAPLQTASYNVNEGTALKSVGLPAQLSVTVAQPADRGKSPGGEELAAVVWKGHYDSSKAGDYKLTAAFMDTAYRYAGPMPEVTVKVSALEDDSLLTASSSESEDLAQSSNGASSDGPSAKENFNNLQISSPRLTADEVDGLGKTVKSRSSKGFYARISAHADGDGAHKVWIGYRFSLKVPDGMDKNWAKFTDVSYSWLMDLETGSKTATPTWDEATKTWTVEGKFYYNEANGLGSSGAVEYSRSIAISTDWLEQDMTLTPTIEVWLPGKAGDPPVSGKGDTVTVVTDPVLDTSITNLTEAISALYSPTKKQLYLRESAAESDGASDAVQGRIYQFTTFTTIETLQKSGNALIPNGQNVTVDIPLSVAKSGNPVVDKEKPILLAAHFDNQAQATVNNYNGALGLLPGGRVQDITYGGRINGYFTTGNQPIKDMTMSSVSYDSASGAIKASLSSTADKPGAPAVLLPGVIFAAGYYQVFVPVPKSDDKDTVRSLSVGRAKAERIKHVGNIETKTIKPSDIQKIRVDYISNNIGDFAGAYSRNFRFGFSSPTSAAVGSGRMDAYISVKNFKTDLWAEIHAYDLLVKIDARAYKVDTTRAAPEKTANHDYKNGSYTLKYGVLPDGGNWPTDKDMNSTRKDALTFYEPGKVPPDAEVVAIMVEARDGRLNIGKDELMLTNLSITDDATKAGAVYQAVVDVDIWSGDNSPGAAGDLGRSNASMMPTEDGGYKKSWYDESGTYHRDAPYQLSGDSLLLLAYDIVGKSYNMNGTNRPDVSADDTSTFDIVQDQRTADIRNEFTINYLGKKGTDNPNLEFELEWRIPKNVGNAVLDPNSIRIDAEYHPGRSEGAAGVISGGTSPISIEDAWSGEYELDWYKVIFKVKGPGVHNIYASVRLGDALNPDRDVPIGKIKYGFERVQASGAARLMVSGNTSANNNFVITKSNAAGFSKVAAHAGIDGKGEASYRMILSAQDQDLTGTFLLDILPFNGDGRGTKLSGGYSIEKPLELTLESRDKTPITAIDIYYTDDALIQRTPRYTVEDVKGKPVSGDKVLLLDVEWVKAPKMITDNNHCSYEVPKNTRAVLGVGKIGSNETPMLDIHLQLHDMQLGDHLMNTAGFTAKQFGKAVESSASSVNVSDRQIFGKAWVDANRNGKQDAVEDGLGGLIVKLYQGETEITKDEYGVDYNVVTDAAGGYRFEHLASSPEKYHVTFTGGGIGDFAVTEKDAPDVAGDENSDVAAYPATGDLVSAVSSEVALLTDQQQNDQKQFLSAGQLDAGFVPRYTVSFDTDGGAPEVRSQTLLINDKVVEPAAPAKENFVFAGWYHDGIGAPAQWDFNAPVVGNMNLKAHWAPAPPAKLSVLGTKTLSGGGKTDKDITDGLFNFKVVRTDAHATEAVTGLPVGPVNVAAGGALNFGTWAFSKTGTYTFSLIENPVPAGYAQAADVLMTVEVAQKDNAALEAVATYSSGDKLTFANAYTAPEGIGVAVAGTKTLTENNNEKVLSAGQFSFQIKSAPGNDATGYRGPAADQVDVQEDGSFSFGELFFSKAGTYRFDVTEVDKKVVGYSYDGKTVAVTVAVTLDTNTNALNATTAYSEDGNPVDSLVFNNKYTAPDPVAVGLTGSVILLGQKDTASIENGDFTFTVKGSAANDAAGYAGSDLIVGVKKGGAIDFGELIFSQAGAYRFDIFENDLGAGGYTYDAARYLATITVVIDTATNTLVPSVVIQKYGETPDVMHEVKSISFVNRYDTMPAASDPLVEKVVKGDHPATPGDFSFTFAAADKANPMPAGSESGEKTVSIKGAGEAEFGELIFTKPGTYIYTVTEQNRGQENYSYDATVYTVTYEVTDEGGRLEASSRILADGASREKIVFTNAYAIPAIPEASDDAPASLLRTGDPADLLLLQTGDSVNLLLLVLAGICLTSGAAMVVFSVRKQKSRR